MQKTPKVAIDILEPLQCHDGERPEVATPGNLLIRNGRDDLMNQHIGGDDKEDYDRFGPSPRYEKTGGVCGKSFVHINTVFR